MKIQISSTSKFPKASRALLVDALDAMIDFQNPYLQINPQKVTDKFPYFEISDFLQDVSSMTFVVSLDGSKGQNLRFKKFTGQFFDGIFYPIDNAPVIKIHPIFYAAFLKMLYDNPDYREDTILDFLFPVRSIYARQILHYLGFRESVTVPVGDFWAAMGIAKASAKKTFWHRRMSFARELVATGFCQKMHIKAEYELAPGCPYTEIALSLQRKHKLDLLPKSDGVFSPYAYIRPSDFFGTSES
jgi:hypothetical protein